MNGCGNLQQLAHTYRLHARTLGLYKGLRAATFPAKAHLTSARWALSPHPVWLRPGTSDIETFCEVLLDGEYEFGWAGKPTTILDVGANIGLAAIWFAVHYPEAKIVAVEAERGNYELMCRNVAPFPTVTPVHAALWSHRATLAVEDPSNWGAWAFQTAELGAGAAGTYGTVEGVTVTDLMDRFALDRIDLLKIDIEGAEREIFADEGALDWLDHVEAIAIELHDRIRPGCSRAFFSRVGEFPVESNRNFTFFVARSAGQA